MGDAASSGQHGRDAARLPVAVRVLPASITPRKGDHKDAPDALRGGMDVRKKDQQSEDQQACRSASGWRRSAARRRTPCSKRRRVSTRRLTARGCGAMRLRSREYDHVEPASRDRRPTEELRGGADGLCREHGGVPWGTPHPTPSQLRFPVPRGGTEDLDEGNMAGATLRQAVGKVKDLLTGGEGDSSVL